MITGINSNAKRGVKSIDIEEKLQKLRDIEGNFLRVKSNEKKSTEKLLLTFISNVQISYGEIDMYVGLLGSERNTVNSLIAVKSCLQSFVDRKGEYDTLMATISTIIAICSFLREIMNDCSVADLLSSVLIFVVVTYMLSLLYLILKKYLILKV